MRLRAFFRPIFISRFFALIGSALRYLRVDVFESRTRITNLISKLSPLWLCSLCVPSVYTDTKWYASFVYIIIPAVIARNQVYRVCVHAIASSTLRAYIQFSVSHRLSYLRLGDIFVTINEFSRPSLGASLYSCIHTKNDTWIRGYLDGPAIFVRICTVFTNWTDLSHSCVSHLAFL